MRESSSSVTPHECALLIGIPLERESFLRKINGPRDGNLADSQFRARSPELSWVGFESLATQLEEIAGEAERLGVQVFRTATIADVERASRQRQVTMISHSRGPMFVPADILDPAKIRSALLAAYPGISIEENAAALTENLNRLCFPGDSAVNGMGAQIRYQKELDEVRHKVTDLLPDAFSGGAGVEFAGGFHGFDEIARAFPPSFCGVIDLIVCNSLVLAELIRNRCARSLVLSTSDYTFPRTRLPSYMAILRLLSRKPMAYEDAFEQLRLALRRKFK
ncbi:MAG: hypothetical protein ABSE51_09175 [Terracidiphilus sp.]